MTWLLRIQETVLINHALTDLNYKPPWNFSSKGTCSFGRFTCDEPNFLMPRVVLSYALICRCDHLVNLPCSNETDTVTEPPPRDDDGYIHVDVSLTSRRVSSTHYTHTVFAACLPQNTKMPDPIIFVVVATSPTGRCPFKTLAVE